MHLSLSSSSPKKTDFEGQSVIKASSYLLPFVLEAHRESLPRSCEPLLADPPPSLLKFTAQQISLLALHTFPSHTCPPNNYIQLAVFQSVHAMLLLAVTTPSFVTTTSTAAAKLQDSSPSFHMFSS